MTYSHNINADMPICRYETAGGICNDSSCDSQHFRNMGLSGALKESAEPTTSISIHLHPIPLMSAG